MAGSLMRHTSMRGRLALLLILLLVVPMVLVGLAIHESRNAPAASAGEAAGSAEGIDFPILQEIRGFERTLDATLTDLAFRTLRHASGRPARPGQSLDDLKPPLRPTHVVELGRTGNPPATLPPYAHALARDVRAQGRSLSGYALATNDNDPAPEGPGRASRQP